MAIPHRSGALLLSLFLLLAGAPAGGQPSPAEEILARDLREEVQHLKVTVTDPWGKSATAEIPVTIFRPPGEGPFPLVVMNHGRATDDKRAAQKRSRPDHLARYLVNKGFVVMAPTRVGYADTYGVLDPEDLGGCASPRVEHSASAASDQVLATVAFARTLSYVDASRWIVMGQSLGGFTSVAVAWRNPPGLVGAVNFSGGHGGNPETRPGNSCADAAVQRLWSTKAGTAKVPMLWFYWTNDQYFGADAPRRWHRAWKDNGGSAEFHQLPPVGKDGHQGILIDMDHWAPIMEQYLSGLGFTRPGIPVRPAPTGFAKLTEPDRVPYGGGNTPLYQRFLASPNPRAIAVGADGAQGIASGDWAIGRALGYCQQKRGAPCKLYAVDADVVWVP